MHGEEHELQRVLGLLAAAEHVAAEGEQVTVVAVVDDLEGRVVTRAQAGDEAIVARGTEQRPRPSAASCCDRQCGCVHTAAFPPTRR
jgi:hypothetical protein